MLQLPSRYKYNKAFPPSVKIKDEFGERFEQLVIPTEITIKDILEINDSKFSVVMMVKLTWRDSHLVFNFLKDSAHYNSLDGSSLDSIWVPDPQFAFLYNGLESIRELQQRVFVQRESAPALSEDIDHLRYSEVYRGDLNNLTFVALYKAEFSCTFSNIAEYPFGEETCLIIFFLKGIDNHLAHLDLTNLTDLGPGQVGQFVIKEWVERKETGDDDSNMRELKCCISILSFSLIFSSEASAWRFISS